MAAADVISTNPHQQLHARSESSENVFSFDELMRRKRDVERNKKLYRLTEADCSLILTNANEFSFQRGQVILAEGQEITSFYRIKSGSVILKNATCECELPKGWFVGESILLGNSPVTTMHMSLIANGPVTILEANVSFVRKLFAADGILALKFYRSLASKLASIFYTLHGNCIESTRSEDSSTNITASSNSISSGSSSLRGSLTHSNSSSSLSSASSSDSTDGQERPAFNRTSSAKFEFASRRTKSKHNLNTSYRDYPLGGNGNVHRKCSIKLKKIKVISECFGFRKKISIEYSRVNNISRTTDVTVTILYDETKARTLFFKDSATATEFVGLVQNLVDQSTAKARRMSPSSPLSQPTSPEVTTAQRLSGTFGAGERLTSFLDSEGSDDSECAEDDFFDEDNEMIRSLADKKVLKKGEVLFSEGDLFQRLYTVTQGSFDVVKDGRAVCSITEGRVFGEASLLHMRPSPFTLTVSSDEATVRVIPAHKLFKLTDANPLLAARMHRKAAQLLEEKISRCKLEMLRRNIAVDSSADSM